MCFRVAAAEDVRRGPARSGSLGRDCERRVVVDCLEEVAEARRPPGVHVLLVAYHNLVLEGYVDDSAHDQRNPSARQHNHKPHALAVVALRLPSHHHHRSERAEGKGDGAQVVDPVETARAEAQNVRERSEREDEHDGKVCPRDIPQEHARHDHRDLDPRLEHKERARVANVEIVEEVLPQRRRVQRERPEDEGNEGTHGVRPMDTAPARRRAHALRLHEAARVNVRAAIAREERRENGHVADGTQHGEEVRAREHQHAADRVARNRNVRMREHAHGVRRPHKCTAEHQPIVPLKREIETARRRYSPERRGEAVVDLCGEDELHNLHALNHYHADLQPVDQRRPHERPLVLHHARAVVRVPELAQAIEHVRRHEIELGRYENRHDNEESDTALVGMHGAREPPQNSAPFLLQ
eukprot:Opistho-1_new@3219